MRGVLGIFSIMMTIEESQRVSGVPDSMIALRMVLKVWNIWLLKEQCAVSLALPSDTRKDL